MADGLDMVGAAALTNGMGGGGFGGFGAIVAIIVILLVLGGGFGNWNRGQANVATQDMVQGSFNYSNLLDQNRDILNQISAGTAQAVAATNQAKYDNINVIKDVQVALTSELGRLETAGAEILAKQNECCCNTLRAIDGVNYNNALNTAAINANITAGVNSIKEQLSQNKIEALQGQVSNLQLQNYLANVVRYPNQTTFTAGFPPFMNGGIFPFA